MELITLKCKKSSKLTFDRGSEGQKALDSGKLENGKDYRYPLAMEK